jgi:hypothetical protein
MINISECLSYREPKLPAGRLGLQLLELAGAFGGLALRRILPLSRSRAR